MVSSPTSVRSRRSSYHEASESSPLLPGSNTGENTASQQSRTRRWASLIALGALCSGIIAVLAIGFIAPAAAERYAHNSVVLDLENISVDSFTSKGVRVHLTSEVHIDASRVYNPFLRTLGRFGARLVRKVHVDPSTIHLYLPDYDGKLLGSAETPPLTIDVRNGHTTSLDIYSNVEPGSLDAIMLLADKVLAGELKELRVLGKANVHIKSGIFGLGTRTVSSEVLVKDFPPLPAYNIGDISIGESKYVDQTVVSANVSLSMENPYNIQLTVPSLGFIISLAGCEPGKTLKTAIATTPIIPVMPGKKIQADVTAMIQSLPADLTNVCHHSQLSPMDQFLGTYLHGEETIVYVSGSGAHLGDDAPKWLVEFLETVTVPVPFPGHALDNVVDSFNLTDVKIDLPHPFADPNSPEGKTRLSATIGAQIAIPDGLNVTLDISRLRAMANVSYHDDMFGVLDLHKWIPTESEILDREGRPFLRVQGKVKNAPVDVTDYDVFEELVQKILFGSDGVELGVAGDADIDLSTGLGNFVIRKIPVHGDISLSDMLPDFSTIPMPTAKDLNVGNTTPHSMVLDITVKAENPSPWSAVVPYANFHVFDDAVLLGNATVENVSIVPGANEFDVHIIWDPLGSGGWEAVKAGQVLIGKYISGENTTLTMRAHDLTFPSQPALSKALESLTINLPTPRISDPTTDPDSPPKFIKYATMHLLSSTAEFHLHNPFPHDFITIVSIDGKASSNGSDLGTLKNKSPFKVWPGRRGGTTTPRLPVRWKVGGGGLDMLWKLVGGEVKVHAEAECVVMIGELTLQVYYNASDPVHARVRL